MNKVAFVTGGSRGIGEAIVWRLAKMGYAVAIGYHTSAQKAAELVHALHDAGYAARAFACDVTDNFSVRETAQSIEAEMGAVCVLVNNAGIAQQKLFTDLTDADWANMLDVHLTGAFYTSRVFVSSMLRRHEGVIINISSMWGQVGGSCEVHYSAAKAGLIGMTKALAKEVAPSGVRVNCVAPGVIMTDMMRDFDEETLTSLKEDTPLMRLGTPEDVANAVAFLVSDEASFITGQVLAPNGGMII